MNPIEEMMEKYGVEHPNEMPQACLQRLEPYNCLGCMLFDEEKEECTHFGDYPPFTPEKQLEVIKTLSKWGSIEFIKNDIIFRIYQPDIKGISVSYDAKANYDIDKALASLMYKIYNQLTFAQKQQIKEILEG